MAYVSNTTASQSVAGRIQAFMGDISTAMQKRRVFRQTFNELASLSDRDLSDLGIVRSEIRMIAREAAYGSRV